MSVSTDVRRCLVVARLALPESSVFAYVQIRFWCQQLDLGGRKKQLFDTSPYPGFMLGQQQFQLAR